MNQQNKPSGNKSVTNRPKPKDSKGTMIIIFMVFVVLILLAITGFGLWQNSKLKKIAIESQRSLNDVTNFQKRNECAIQNAICIYGKTTAVDDYLSIVSNTLKIQQNTSYDIMLEIVPSKLAAKDNPINTDCRTNNHYLYICQRMASSTPKKLLQQLIPIYDVLSSSIEYQVSLVMVPRVHLIPDESEHNTQQEPKVEGTQTEQVPSNQQPLDQTQSSNQYQEQAINNSTMQPESGSVNQEAVPESSVQQTLDNSQSAPPNTFGQNTE